MRAALTHYQATFGVTLNADPAAIHTDVSFGGGRLVEYEGIFTIPSYADLKIPPLRARDSSSSVRSDGGVLTAPSAYVGVRIRSRSDIAFVDFGAVQHYVGPWGDFRSDGDLSVADHTNGYSIASDQGPAMVMQRAAERVAARAASSGAAAVCTRRQQQQLQHWIVAWRNAGR